MDRYPDLKLCLGHAGGYTAFGAARMDKGWRAGALENMPEFDDSRSFLQNAPSEYLSRFYYDSCTYTEPTLRFLIDMVGIDQVALGTDHPVPMFLDDPVNWINGLESHDVGGEKGDPGGQSGVPARGTPRLLSPSVASRGSDLLSL